MYVLVMTKINHAGFHSCLKFPDETHPHFPYLLTGVYIAGFFLLYLSGTVRKRTFGRVPNEKKRLDRCTVRSEKRIFGIFYSTVKLADFSSAI